MDITDQGFLKAKKIKEGDPGIANFELQGDQIPINTKVTDPEMYGKDLPMSGMCAETNFEKSMKLTEILRESHMPDPDHEEMMSYLQKQYERLMDKSTIDDEAEVAIYWFANDFHGGQSSNLYSVLSTSPYRPGPNTTMESEGDGVKMMYDDLVEKFGGGGARADEDSSFENGDGLDPEDLKKFTPEPGIKKGVNVYDKIQREGKWLKNAVHPSRKGMFDGKTVEDLEKMKAALKARDKAHAQKGEKIPHKNKVAMAQILFAIRGKKHKLQENDEDMTPLHIVARKKQNAKVTPDELKSAIDVAKSIWNDVKDVQFHSKSLNGKNQFYTVMRTSSQEWICKDTQNNKWFRTEGYDSRRDIRWVPFNPK